MKWRTTYLLLIVLLLQTALGLLFRQVETTEYIRILITQAVALFLPSILYLALYRMPAARLQGRGLTWMNALLAIILMLCTGVLSQFINAPIAQMLASHRIPAAIEPQTSRTFFEFTLSVLFLCAIPAIVEELLFRGIVLREYASIYGAPRAILLSAAIYTIFHFDLSACLPQFLIGLVTAILVFRTGSLLTGMIAHFSNNFLSLMIQLYTMQFTQLFTTHAVWMITASCCLLCISGWGLFLYNPRSKKEQIKPIGDFAK